MVTLADGMWSGQSCLIVGGGPSLRGFNFRRCERNCPPGKWGTIAINKAGECFLPDLWYGSDSVFWRKKADPRHFEFHRTSNGRFPRVWVDTGEKHPGEDKVDVVVPCAAPPGTPNRHAALAWGRSLAEGVGAGGNSGFAALNLADVLGAETIYLLGFDLRGENGKTANWHEGYGPKEVANASIYDRFLESFRWAASQVRARVVVLEVRPGDSRLDCWPKIPAGEVL